MTIYRSWSDMPQLLGDLMTREWGGVVAVAASGPEASGTVERIVGTATRAVRALRENELFVRIVELDPQLLLPYLLSRRGRSQQAILDLVADQLRPGRRPARSATGDPACSPGRCCWPPTASCSRAHTMVDDTAAEEALDAELAPVIDQGWRRDRRIDPARHGRPAGRASTSWSSASA